MRLSITQLLYDDEDQPVGSQLQSRLQVRQQLANEEMWMSKIELNGLLAQEMRHDACLPGAPKEC